MNRFSGVTVDFYDDKGALIKQRFPNLEDVPEVIKTANVKPEAKLPNEAFALVAIDSGQIMRKFACYDPGTTAMSVIYFMENRDKLPESAVKMAAQNLHAACHKHDLLPPDALTKIALTGPGLEISMVGLPSVAGYFLGKDRGMGRGMHGEPPPTFGLGDLAALAFIPGTTGYQLGLRSGHRLGSALAKPKVEPQITNVDITGQEARPKTASALSRDEDFALVTEEGRRLYPIHDWDHVKQACDFWALESRRFEPSHRRQFAVKVASKASELGFHIDDATLLEAAAPSYAEEDHIKTAMEMRKVSFMGSDNKEHREFLDELVEKRASMNPDVFAECVRRFDIMHGLDRGWDHVVLSPWETTFGLQKTAQVVWEDAADRVTDEELINLARNHSGGLAKKYDDDFVKGFEKDPVGLFNSMPLPHKRIIARLANDMASRGGSFMSSYNEQDPKDSGTR